MSLCQQLHALADALQALPPARSPRAAHCTLETMRAVRGLADDVEAAPGEYAGLALNLQAAVVAQVTAELAAGPDPVRREFLARLRGSLRKL